MVAKTRQIKLTKAWNQHQKGAVLDLNEPVAETLVGNGMAEFTDNPKLSTPGTKKVNSSRVTAKG